MTGNKHAINHAHSFSFMLVNDVMFIFYTISKRGCATIKLRLVGVFIKPLFGFFGEIAAIIRGEANQHIFHHLTFGTKVYILRCVLVGDAQLREGIFKAIIVKLIARITVDLVKYDNIKLVLQSVGHHLIVALASDNRFAAFCFVLINVSDYIVASVAVLPAGAHLRINRFLSLHIARKTSINYCS
nr:hypothetical protein [uncultured Phascolarctobacterium sp.]